VLTGIGVDDQHSSKSRVNSRSRVTSQEREVGIMAVGTNFRGGERLLLLKQGQRPGEVERNNMLTDASGKTWEGDVNCTRLKGKPKQRNFGG